MATSLGKRGRSNPQSKEATYGSKASFDKYFKKHANNLGSTPTQSEEVNPSLNKSWVKESLKQNKQYEKVNKLHTRDGEWVDVFKKADKRGMSTKKLESKARLSDNSNDMKEYGFKPHVKNVMKTYDELKEGGYLPNVKISGFDVKMSKSGVYGSYRTTTGEYVLNANALSLPRIEKNMRTGKLAGLSYKDVIVHELGHGVYFQNMVKPVYINNPKGGKTRVKFTAKQTAIRNAYAKLTVELRKSLRKGDVASLSQYVYVHRQKSIAKTMKNKKTGERIVITKDQRKSSRRSSYIEGFAEGYVNYYRHRKFGEPLHPMGKAVGNFLKEINRYK